MNITLYLHSSKETNYDKGKSAGLSGEALKLFLYAGDEHAVEYEVDPTGKAIAISFDGRKIEPAKT